MKSTRLISVIIYFILLGCSKQGINENNTVNNTFTDSALSFLKASISTDEFSRLDIKNIQKLKWNDNSIGIKLNQAGQQKRFILLFKEGMGFFGNRVDISGLRLNDSGKNEGTCLVEYFDKRPGQQFIVENNKVIKETGFETIESANSGKEPSTGPVEYEHNQKTSGSEELPEFVVVGYVKNTAVDFFSLYWLLGGSASYSYFYTDSPNGSGGGDNDGKGPSSSGLAIAPLIISPDHPIPDIKEELKCFTMDNTSTYSISVNVNQPVPNSRQLANFKLVRPVGHTFMTLEQIFLNGKSVVRNIGFYPKKISKPGNSVDASIFGDDSNTFYDVSLKISLTNTEFSDIISTIINQQQLDYELENFNCTNAVLDAFNSINVHLPNSKSKAPLFKGYNPADLGRDIRI